MLKTAYMAENGMSIRGKKTLIKNGMKAVGKNKIRNCCDGKR
jgi:hypothetical protein